MSLFPLLKIFRLGILITGLTACLTNTQGAPSPTVLTATPRPDGVELSFTSHEDFRYTLEYRDQLSDETSWQDLEAFREIQGTGDLLSFTDTAIAAPHLPVRYYRLRIKANPPTSGADSTVLALYEFSESTPQAQLVHTNVIATDFGLSAGTLFYGSFNANTWTGSGVPYAQGNTGWGATTSSEAKYFHVTVVAREEAAFSITNIRFLARATSAGPAVFGVFINGQPIDEQNIAADTTTGVDLTVQGFNNLTQAVVRIAGWANGSRTTTGGGQFRIDDVRLEGLLGLLVVPELPVVANPAHSSISATSATLGGELIDDGNSAVTERGIFWSTLPGFSPPGEGIKISENGLFAPGIFTMAVFDLPPDTTIYFRAFAANAVGIGLTEEATFTTPLGPPSVTNPSAAGITETTALLGGSVTHDGGEIIVERGVYWSLTPEFEPPEQGTKISEFGEFEPGAFSLPVQNLPAGSEIYMRAFASNAEQTGFSPLYTFTTTREDELAFYSFTGNSTHAERAREAIRADAISVSSGNFTFQSPDEGQTAEWQALGAANPQLVAAGGWAIPHRADAKHFLLTLATESGWQMTITNIRYLARSTSQGPSAVGFAVNSDPLHEVDAPANTVLLVESAVAGYADITGAVIRIEGWHNLSRSTTGDGELHIDSIMIQGVLSEAVGVGEPVVTSPVSSAIGANSATLGGTVAETGGTTITERGVYWSTVADFPFGTGTKVSQSGSFDTGPFSLAVSTLPPETVIYFRAFARNVAATAYTEQQSFTTAAQATSLIALYEFTGALVTPQARHPALTSSHLVHKNGRPGTGNNNPSQWTGSGVPYAQLAGGFAETDIHLAQHFIYAIEARPGSTFAITNISFLARATAAGPSALSVSIDGDIIHTQDMPNGSILSVNVPVTGYSEQTLSRIRIHGWNNGSRSTTGTGLFQIDDVRTEGVVAGTPLPPVPGGRLVRVASYNIENGIGQVGDDKYNAIKSTLERIEADIVAFQELFFSQSNQWVALAAELGYPHTALAPEGGQRTGYFSRYPILSTHYVQSPSPANEMARPVGRIVVDVPEAETPLVIWNAHKKALGDDINQFRRAVETLRIINDIDQYRTAHTGHVAYIVLGDMNADVFTQPQSVSFSESWFNDNQASLPASYQLGEDIEFPVAYAWFPDERYADGHHAVHRSFMTQADGNGLYSFEDNSFISRLDYIYLSPALAEALPVGEIYNSHHDGTFPGLPKGGTPLPANTSGVASDHLPIFIDIYMSPEPAPGDLAESSPSTSSDTLTQHQDSTLFSGMTVPHPVDEEGDPAPPAAADRPGTPSLMEVALATRLEIVPLPENFVELQFPSVEGFLYTIDSLSDANVNGSWSVVKDYEQIAGTGEPISRGLELPPSNVAVRFYRVRVEQRVEQDQ
ncbi:MAG TPA: hypothetical protein PKE55_02745 [Kiritimatiellia bacterium]|nr:hypothetical protein [Kiritimatiellia bacterium]